MSKRTAQSIEKKRVRALPAIMLPSDCWQLIVCHLSFDATADLLCMLLVNKILCGAVLAALGDWFSLLPPSERLTRGPTTPHGEEVLFKPDGTPDVVRQQQYALALYRMRHLCHLETKYIDGKKTHCASRIYHRRRIRLLRDNLRLITKVVGIRGVRE